MKTISSVALVAASLFLGLAIATDDNLPSEGCFSSTTGLTLAEQGNIYTSKGTCSKVCLKINKIVFGLTNSTSCFCGSELPPTGDKVDSSSCNLPCPGYPTDDCGGDIYTAVYLTSDSLQGTVANVNSDGSVASTITSATAQAQATPSKTASASATVVTTVVGGQTQTVTATPTSTASAKSSGGGTNKAAIAAGVVVGLIAIAAVAGGVFLFMRNKSRRELEEEHRRQAAISQFTGGKHPSSAGNSSFSDTRLDPAVMAQRRMSDGSIMDNQDYSRRILKVTNA